MRPRCGICNCIDQELLCSSCTDFELLRPRLEYLEALRQSSEAKRIVDDVLSKCIKGQNFDFLTKYIVKIKRSKSADQAEGDPKTGSGSIPSQGSVAALSSQLLTIDAILLKRRSNKIQREINAAVTRKKELIAKFDVLKSRVEARRTSLESRRSSQEPQDVVKHLREEAMYKTQDNKNLIKQIHNSRSLLFQELINIYIIKKRKISGTTRTIFMLSFTPILSTYNLVDFNYEAINACLERMSKFIHQVSKVLLVTLPYQITFTKEAFYKPSIMKFDLYLKENQQLWTLSSFELRLLVNGIARLMINAYHLLKVLELDEDVRQYSDLMRLDSMLYKLANNDYSWNRRPSASGREGSEEPRSQSPVPDDQAIENGKVDVDKLVEMVYGVVDRRINSKNNEWHVVKKEYLVDDE